VSSTGGDGIDNDEGITSVNKTEMKNNSNSKN
jgi:hypothetical protein